MPDLDWRLLTDASANLGNALTSAAGNVRQHRETSANRAAVTNYLSNPDDAEAFKGLARRNPEMAFRIQDQHVERARQLRGDHQQQLQYLGRIVHDVHDDASYQAALALARQAGIDITGHEAYDPQFVGALQELDRRLNRVAPIIVPEGGRAIDPDTGSTVASGAPRQPRYFAIPPGGRLELDPSYSGPTTDDPAPPAAPAGEAPAFGGGPLTVEDRSGQYPSRRGGVPTGNPLDPHMGAGGIVQVNSFEEAAALPPGTVFLMRGETVPRVRH